MESKVSYYIDGEEVCTDEDYEWSYELVRDVVIGRRYVWNTVVKDKGAPEVFVGTYTRLFTAEDAYVHALRNLIFLVARRRRDTVRGRGFVGTRQGWVDCPHAGTAAGKTVEVGVFSFYGGSTDGLILAAGAAEAQRVDRVGHGLSGPEAAGDVDRDHQLRRAGCAFVAGLAQAK